MRAADAKRNPRGPPRLLGLACRTGAVGAVNTVPFVTNPGYVAPSGDNPNGWSYYFTARDAFRTEGSNRTDLTLNYAYRIPAPGRLIEVFFVFIRVRGPASSAQPAANIISQDSFERRRDGPMNKNQGFYLEDPRCTHLYTRARHMGPDFSSRIDRGVVRLVVARPLHDGGRFERTHED